MDKTKMIMKLIDLNCYIEYDIAESKKSADFWKQRLQEEGDVVIAPKIDPNRTYASALKEKVERIEKLQQKLKENEEWIEQLRKEVYGE
ncbi:hypothetical protein [Anaerophilus nitritogenes]|uniref:hypothetical protein n=1 Tax=Anaerophilus nitritogenes TaxID=2498136 RepID=UPI00101D4571|nr:hypothetical protein [Anaerophilus nitritogenes]